VSGHGKLTSPATDRYLNNAGRAYFEAYLKATAGARYGGRIKHQQHVLEEWWQRRSPSNALASRGTHRYRFLAQ